ncbi:NAD-dependent epimerase/dehydratase family protein [Enterovirga rhinocerotis]|uniref:Nucleoside-diphosphate-sugar epimerase n=1 Tax=Enterovirga rhinocerotis TaxID=1339210 RepID=A0A4R7BSY3_9HYPH|nr:NAD-dependent epimerase/dehydratase family protein [Enterovirga rhinocerotis]TDR88012.1 nucleoside-diphosphate-sugar epimerase [Enterovirga rhinocerotis]
MASTVFLAGASGAVGSRLIPFLTAAGYRVHGTTRERTKADRLRALGAEPVIVDVYDAPALREAVATARPDIVVHQLTDLPAGMKTDDMAAALARNSRLREIGTANLVEAARLAGARRLVAQSIAFVYAPGPLPHDEADPIDPGQRGVLSLESQVLDGPIDGVVLRFGRLFGPGTGFDAPNPSSPVHVDAAAHAALLAIAKGSGAYNIAEETGEVSAARARRDLGWKADVRLRD